MFQSPNRDSGLFYEERAVVARTGAGGFNPLIGIPVFSTKSTGGVAVFFLVFQSPNRDSGLFYRYVMNRGSRVLVCFNPLIGIPVFSTQ